MHRDDGYGALSRPVDVFFQPSGEMGFLCPVVVVVPLPRNISCLGDRDPRDTQRAFAQHPRS
jgi:hypothetical protein